METQAGESKKKRRPQKNTIPTRAVVATTSITFHIGHRLRNPLNESVHWADKARMKTKFMREAHKMDAPLAVKTITFIRWYPPRSKPFDVGDNLPAAFKWFRDAACDWLGVDDGPSCPITFEYEQHQADAFGASMRFS